MGFWRSPPAALLMAELLNCSHRHCLLGQLGTAAPRACKGCRIKARLCCLSVFLEVSVHCSQQNTATPTSSQEGAGTSHRAQPQDRAPRAFTEHISQQNLLSAGCPPESTVCPGEPTLSPGPKGLPSTPCHGEPAPQGAAGE